MLKNLSALASFFFTPSPTEVVVTDLNDLGDRPFELKVPGGFLTYHTFYVRCQNLQVKELQDKGLQVYAFTGDESKVESWVPFDRVDYLIDLFSYYSTYPGHPATWM
jgi:hypothetical protein